MNKHITLLLSILILVLVSGALLTACGTTTTAAPPSTVPPVVTADGKTLLESRCTVCHNLDRVTSSHKTTADWTATVQKMIGKGAKLNAQEQQLVINYLAQTYP